MGTIRKNLQNIAATLLVLAIITPGAAGAEQYDVNAFIPYPTPTQPATIDVPTANSVTHTALQTVSGTCQSASPVNVVSIWRNGQMLGSAACTGGAYSIQVTLALGQNTLVARTANQNGIYGPDSVSVLVSFQEPDVVEPLPPSVNEPTTNRQRTGATNQGSLNDLSLRTESPFSVLKSGNVISMRVVVEGGKNPYVLRINWGDGSTESHGIAQAGVYEFSHTYQRQQGYTVHIYVKDILGSYTEYVYAVVTSDTTTDSKTSSKDSVVTNSGMLANWYVPLFLVLLLVLILTSYWFGWYRGKRSYAEKTTRRGGAPKRKRPRKERK